MIAAPPPLVTIPEHLREYITEQDPSLYTPIDQAAWRYIMRVSKAFFSKNAHPLYLTGLEATGISTERIPLVKEMDIALQKLGWRAVAINGFIPPSTFLEFQSLKILAIACDMRKIENLGYTPSPDIVHEAAGHAPIVADPGYRSYLEAYGQVARNAIISKYDLDLYQAIFNLSEIKEDPHSTPEKIREAQLKFEEISDQEESASEAAVLTRMAWWTTEYGLIGSLEKPLIYGAGLLSSVAESFNCLNPDVEKIPFSLEKTISTSYDITSQQPQLFVAESFDQLKTALEEFANTMAFRRGGVFGLKTGHEAQATVTVRLDNEIEISGIISQFGHTELKEESFFEITGPKQISFRGIASPEIPHYNLGSKIFVPLFEKSITASPPADLQRKLHSSGLYAKNGMRVLGHFKKEVSIGSHARVLILEHVKIYDQHEKLIFEEHQKPYPLFLTNHVTSVYGGAADRKEFALRSATRTQRVKAHKTNLTEDNVVLNRFYQAVRVFREEGRADVLTLGPLMNELNTQYPNDWLLRLELFEIHLKHAPDSMNTAQLRKQLKSLRDLHPDLTDLIQRGLDLK